MGEVSGNGWIMHDGSGGPRISHRQTIELAYDIEEAKGKLTSTGEASLTPSWPGFFWSWKRVRTGWFKFEMRRICDDPNYAPIKAYRLQKPRSNAADRLAEIVASPPGQWIKDDTDIDQRLPKRVPA